MTHVKLNGRPGTLTNLVDELFNGLPAFNDIGTVMPRTSVPVNISETQEEYRLEVIAPGFDKSEFSVQIEDKLLTISGLKKENVKGEKENEEKKIKTEFSYPDFKRSFTIDDKIDATQIRASYVNGVLRLNLPKKREVKEAAKEITIH